MRPRLLESAPPEVVDDVRETMGVPIPAFAGEISKDSVPYPLAD